MNYLKNDFNTEIKLSDNENDKSIVIIKEEFDPLIKESLVKRGDIN